MSNQPIYRIFVRSTPGFVSAVSSKEVIPPGFALRFFCDDDAMGEIGGTANQVLWLIRELRRSDIRIIFDSQASKLELALNAILEPPEK